MYNVGSSSEYVVVGTYSCFIFMLYRFVKDIINCATLPVLLSIFLRFDNTQNTYTVYRTHIN